MEKHQIFYGENKMFACLEYRFAFGLCFACNGKHEATIDIQTIKLIVSYENSKIINMYDPNDI